MTKHLYCGPSHRHGGRIEMRYNTPLIIVLREAGEEQELLVVRHAEVHNEQGTWRHYFVVSYEKGGKVLTSASIGLWNADPPVDLGHGYVLTTRPDIPDGLVWEVKRLTTLKEAERMLPLHIEGELPKVTA